MDEKKFMLDLWDVIRDNGYCTIEQFREKYASLFYDMNLNGNALQLGDDHNDWRLFLQKVWSDETNAK